MLRWKILGALPLHSVIDDLEAFLESVLRWIWRLCKRIIRSSSPAGNSLDAERFLETATDRAREKLDK